MNDNPANRMTKKGRSKISDEELARQIDEDCRLHPIEYGSEFVYSDNIPDSKYLFKNTSATFNDRIRKWL